jgi:hydroxyacylglutathione hydrolase
MNTQENIKTSDDFYLQQISTSCLAQFSYYLESEGEALIIDPMRDSRNYLKILEERNAKLKYIFETHFHADFVSGHVELANLTGATIIYGPNSSAEFNFHQAKDEEIFEIGKIKIKVLHSPGHTLESSCFLLIDSQGKNRCVFTGDTLFLGEVGRPDLASNKFKNEGITEKDLATMLYESIHTKLKPLEDNVIVYPGHGAGSACGKNISSGGSDTLGNQKLTNYVFSQNLNKTEFIENLIQNLTPPPQYFFYSILLNKTGYNHVNKVLEKSNKKISLEEYEKIISIDKNVITLDTRESDDVCKGFIPDSISITLKTNYATWTGTLYSPEQKIILVTEKGKEEESITRLTRIGYENILGYLEGGFEAWKQSGREFSIIENLEIQDVIQKVVEDCKNKKNIILDVREKGEFQSTGVLPNSMLLPLSKFKDSNQDDLKKIFIQEEEENLSSSLPQNTNIYLLCRSGNRTLIAASILKKLGVKNNFINLRGGSSILCEKGNTLFEKYSQ